MFTGLQVKFLVFIAVVFLITIGFAYLIWRQMKKTGQAALEAKQRQNEYQSHLTEEQKSNPAE